MQLLTQAVMDVALSALSKIAHERDRIAGAYLRSVSLGALIRVSTFVLLAAIAPEFSLLLFGAKWGGSEAVMRPLMLIGAVQTVQFVNSAYFGAPGKPNYVFAAQHPENSVRSCRPCSLLPSRDIGQLATIFAFSQARGDPRHVCAGPAAAWPELEPVSASALQAAFAPSFWLTARSCCAAGGDAEA